VAVDHVPDLIEPGSGGPDRGLQRHPVRAVVAVDPRIVAHPGVHQQQAVGVCDEVAEARLDVGRTGHRLGAGPDEIAEVGASHVKISHTDSVVPAPANRPSANDKRPVSLTRTVLRW
jgi:hypothetical protein